MKIIKNIFKIAFLSIGINVMAQVLPVPPVPPSTSTSTSTSIITSKSVSYKDKTGNTTFSTSSTNKEYSLKSRYPSSKYTAIKNFLIEELGTNNMKLKEETTEWNLASKKNEVYNVELTKRKLNVKLNKTLASSELASKFNDIGDVLRSIVSGKSLNKHVQELEREADRARQSAERMRMEAERLRALADRDAARVARESEKAHSLAERDAARVSHAAAILSKQAEELSLISSRSGGIDGYMREVLQDPSTIYKDNGKENNGWKWPAMQKALLTKLQKDNLVKTNEDVVFIKEDNGMYVNGEKLSPSAWSSYNSLFRTYNYNDFGDISFFKQGDHIAVVNSDIDFEDILDILENKRLIENKTTSTIIELNGSSIMVNGTRLPNAETKAWNALLHRKNVIPAPGKTIKIGEGYASLGYSFDNNTLGTWMSRE